MILWGAEFQTSLWNLNARCQITVQLVLAQPGQGAFPEVFA